MVTCEDDRSHLFRIYLPHSACVELVGTFTGWKHGAIPMRRLCDEEAGWWEARLGLDAGDHEFSYLVDGSCWMPDYAANGVRRNHFGNWISTLHVAGAAAPPTHTRSHGRAPAFSGAEAATDRFGRLAGPARADRPEADAEERVAVRHGR